MKRLIDIVLSGLGLLFASPLICLFAVLIYSYDGKNPFYIAPRSGKNGRQFRMVKLRSMAVDADKSGVDSTSNSDRRITPIGKVVRKYKADELMQLWNVLVGDMSLTGPRPNVKRETDLYTHLEMDLLKVKPGITDFASIVFSDEGDILESQEDPDISYHQLIRPGKSALGLFYVYNNTTTVDLSLVAITAVNILNRPLALNLNLNLLRLLGAPNTLLTIASRSQELSPMPPPGSSQIVTTRDGRIM